MTLPFLLRSVTYFGTFLAMLFLERMVPFAPSDQRKAFRVLFHLGISIVNSILLYLVMTWPIITAITASRSYNLGIMHHIGLTGWVEVAATFVVFDFWIYWMHRANHRFPLFWRFHRAHHSDTEIDVTTAARFHIGELIISNCFKCLMILLWGPSLPGLVAFDVLLNVCSQFHHSNIRIPLRIQDSLEHVIVTPRMHRCHHALHKDCFNTNFATFFSWWDRLFRSYHWAQAPSELRMIGLPRPRGESTMKLKPFFLTPMRLE